MILKVSFQFDTIQFHKNVRMKSPKYADYDCNVPIIFLVISIFVNIGVQFAGLKVKAVTG